MQFGDSRAPASWWERLTPEPNSGCWLWTGGTFANDGAPRLHVSARLHIRVHREMYALVQGNPDGMDVKQRCRVKICCNPDHLVLEQRLTAEDRRTWQRNWEREARKDPEYRKRKGESARASYWKDPARSRALAVLRAKRRYPKIKAAKYGLTPKEVAALIASQGGRCAICEQALKPGVGGAAIDHDHDSGAVRGMLCCPCNLGLGHFRDDAERLARAAVYLSKRGAQ